MKGLITLFEVKVLCIQYNAPSIFNYTTPFSAIRIVWLLKLGDISSFTDGFGGPIYYPDESRSVVCITNLIAGPLTLCGAMNNVSIPQENICYFIRGLMFVSK
jgi:hypothetical protein